MKAFIFGAVIGFVTGCVVTANTAMHAKPDLQENLKASWARDRANAQ